MARPVHFEIAADDTKRAVKFFSDVFGWQFQEWENSGYHLAATGKEEHGIDGAVLSRKDTKQPITNSIQVDSIEDYAKKIEAAGGRMIVPKTAIGQMGWSAYFTDTEGNTHGLFELNKAAQGES